MIKLFFEDNILKFDPNESSLLRFGTGGDFEATKQEIVELIKDPYENSALVCNNGDDKYLIKIASGKYGLYLELHKTPYYAERCSGDEDKTFEEAITLCQGDKEKQLKFLEEIAEETKTN